MADDAANIDVGPFEGNAAEDAPPEERHGVRRPTPNPGNHKEVRNLLEVLCGSIWEQEWKGKAGPTDWSVYLNLLRVAYHHGQMITAGVRVSISVRDLALKAGVRLPTLLKSLDRLGRDRGLIRRDGRGEGLKSGAFVLLAGERTTRTLIQMSHLKSSTRSTTHECLARARVPLRWGAGRLGKKAEMILEALRWLGGHASAKKLAATIKHTRVRDLERRQLSSMVGLGLLINADGVYKFHPDFGWNLELELSVSVEPGGLSEKDADERDRLRYEMEREDFKGKWERGEVISEDERRERKRWSRRKAELDTGSTP